MLWQSQSILLGFLAGVMLSFHTDLYFYDITDVIDVFIAVFGYECTYHANDLHLKCMKSQITRFMGPAWGPLGPVGPMKFVIRDG